MKLMEIMEDMKLSSDPTKKRKRTFLKIKNGKYKNQLATYAGITNAMPGYFIAFIPALGMYTYLTADDIVIASLKSVSPYIRKTILSTKKQN